MSNARIVHKPFVEQELATKLAEALPARLIATVRRETLFDPWRSSTF
jgi:hypothetical protein